MSDTQGTIDIPTTRPAASAIMTRLEQCKGAVQAFAWLPETHLALVCIQTRPGEYVTWKVNIQVMFSYKDCGCCHGHYFTTGGATFNCKGAMASFHERLAEAWGGRRRRGYAP